MDKSAIIGTVAGVIVGFMVGKMSGRRKDKIVWTKAVDPRKIDPEVIALLDAGQKIQAIKRYRAIYDVDLKDAKDAVDALEEHRVSGA